VCGKAFWISTSCLFPTEVVTEDNGKSAIYYLEITLSVNHYTTPRNRRNFHEYLKLCKFCMKYGIFLKLCTINLTEFPLHYSSVITNLISSEEATDSAEACVNLEPSEDCMCCIHWSIHNSEVLRNLQRHCHNALQCFTTHCAWVSEWVSEWVDLYSEKSTTAQRLNAQTKTPLSVMLNKTEHKRSSPNSWDPDWEPDQPPETQTWTETQIKPKTQTETQTKTNILSSRLLKTKILASRSKLRP